MKHCLLISCVLFFLQPKAQPKKKQLLGDWKFYLTDKTSFEFLRLNADGTGIKCFGQTLNGKDTFFLDHITALQIKSWEVNQQTLIIQSNNNVSFAVNPRYKILSLEKDKIALQGEHLILYLYPSILNRKEFQRTVTYQRANTIPKDYGVNTAACIAEDTSLFLFKPIDSLIQIAQYKGFSNLIPYIVGCHYGYEYAPQYQDPAYSLQIPASIKSWSFGFGNKNFYISFDSEKDDTSETSIVIYYDFGNGMKDYYFSQMEKGVEKKDIVIYKNKDIYKTINWQGKYEGKIFFKNSIAVAYYTKNKQLEERLQKCIASFSYTKREDK